MIFISFWADFKEGASWWDPRGPYFFIRDPTPENLAKAIFPYTATTTSMYYFVRWLDPVSMRGVGIREFSRNLFLHNMDTRLKALRSIAIGGARYAAATGVVAVPTAISAATTYAYEKKVNEPIRKSHPGSQGTWFGPYGSGFGSVV